MKKYNNLLRAFMCFEFFALVLSFSLGQNLYAQSTSDFKTRLNNTGNVWGVTITGYTGQTLNVKIPDIIDGKPVTAIGPRAFYNERLVGVQIPPSVFRIGEEAFWGCNLEFAAIPESLTFLGANAFDDYILAEIGTALPAFSSATTISKVYPVVAPQNNKVAISRNSGNVEIRMNAQTKNAPNAGNYTTDVQSIYPRQPFNPVTDDYHNFSNSNIPSNITPVQRAVVTGGTVNRQAPKSVLSDTHPSELFRANPSSKVLYGDGKTNPISNMPRYSVGSAEVRIYNDGTSALTKKGGVPAPDEYPGEPMDNLYTSPPIGYHESSRYNGSHYSEDSFFDIYDANDNYAQGNYERYGWGANEYLSYTGENGRGASRRYISNSGTDLYEAKISVDPEYGYSANIEKYFGTDTRIDIPSVIENVPVVSIGPNSFMAKKISAIIIPETVTSIGLAAFTGNLITAVRIPRSVRNIDYQAFAGNPLAEIDIGPNVNIREDSFSKEFAKTYQTNLNRGGKYRLNNKEWIYMGNR